MTSKERLMAALKREVPDRVPICTCELAGWNPDSPENKEESFKSLMDYIREYADCTLMTGVQAKNGYLDGNVSAEKWQKGKSTFTRTKIMTPKGELTSLSRYDEGVWTAWALEHLIKDNEDIHKWLSIPYDPEPIDISHMKKQEEALGDKGILLVDVGDPLCGVAGLFDFEDFLVKAYTDRGLIIKLLDKMYEQQIYILKNMLKQGAGPMFRIVGPEYATAPYLYPKDFCEFVCKYDKELIRLIHEHGKYARIHCHGRIRDVLPHMIEMEVDALDPLEAPPSGDITLAEVKKKYGNKLSLWGNVQLGALEAETPERVREIVKECMASAKDDGGYVIMTTASPIKVPLPKATERNYKVFIDTAIEYGQY